MNNTEIFPGKENCNYFDVQSFASHFWDWLWHELLVTGSWVKSSEKVEALLRARTLASTDLFSSIFQCASSRTTFPVCLWSLYSLHSMSPKQIKGQTRCLRLECLEPPFFPSSIATWQMIEHDNFSEGMVSQEGHDYPTNKSWVKTIWVGKHGSSTVPVIF